MNQNSELGGMDFGKYIEDPEQEKRWEFIGVFDTKDKAVDVCIYESYFIAPVKLNESFPDETVEWKGAYYPLLEKPITQK